MGNIFKAAIVAAFLLGTVSTVLDQPIVGKAHALDQKGLHQAVDAISKAYAQAYKAAEDEMKTQIGAMGAIQDPAQRKKLVSKVMKQYQEKLSTLHKSLMKSIKDVEEKYRKAAAHK